MEILKIEKNIPLPKNSKLVYPFKDMEIGDSIFVSPKTKGNSATVAFRSYINYNRLEWKIKTRIEGDGIRIWRIL